MIMPVLFAAASSFDRKYEKSMSEGNRENALIYIRSAESLDTFNADYKVKYANLLLSSEGLTKEDFETAKKLVSSAEKAGKYSAETLQNAAILYGIELVDRAIELIL